jgi:O-antigen ligase
MRAISTSVDPNVFGAMLMLAGVFTVSQLLTRRPVIPRVAIAAMLATILAALLLSYSRGSWIGLFAGCLLIALLRYRKPWVLIALFLGVGLLAVLPGLGGFFAHLQSGLAARDQAAAMRLGEYKDAFRLIEQYPLFGVGFGAAPEIDLYVGVSSVYLLLAEQMGLLGLAAFVGVVGAVLFRAMRTALTHAGTGLDSILVGSVAAMAAALVAGLLDHHFVNIRFPHMTALFWLVAALCVISGELAREASPSDEREAG